MTDKSLFRCENIGKVFGESRVLNNVNFSVKAGEIVVLVGENGAGKSTLMNIFFGMPAIMSTGGYEGQLFLREEPVKFSSPNEALGAGIGMVHQEFSLIPGFTGTENILLNREPTERSILETVFGQRINTINRGQMHKRAKDALGKLGVRLNQEERVSNMPVGHKQFLEIAREIDRSETALLVLDEPTAVLAESEASVLLKAIKALADSGLGIIFISHRLREVMELCHKVVVLRDGQKVAEMESSQTSVRDIASYMMLRNQDYGAEVSNESAPSTENPVILKVRDLWVDMPGEMVHGVDLDVHEGEIFGLAGLAGQGKLGVPAGIMGLKPAGGTVTFAGKPLPLNKPNSCLRSGLAFVSEDRRGVGLLLDESIQTNIAFSALQVRGQFLRRKFGLWPFIDEEAMRDNALGYIESLAIKCANSKQKVGHLSGGNQQKVCLAKAFTLNPKLLFVSEPTRGIDVGAKELVLDSIRRYNQAAGTTVMVVSSELEELRRICHRIAVINEGQVAGILPAKASATQFGLLMSGEKDV
ncbi:MAG: sugar ABC transporter ATP-binding protein [Candidatus Adiutrix sp.]